MRVTPKTASRTRATPKTIRHPVRNPYYEQVQREGVLLIARASRTDRPVRNPYYERVQKAGGIRLFFNGQGRPPKAQSLGPTTPRSVRLPPAVWERVEAQAQREGKTVHAAIREGILLWLKA